MLPNGNVLALVWDRVSKEHALGLGRRPELLPDGELWNNLVIELQPDLAGKCAREIWRWSMLDHVIQDFCPERPNYGIVEAHPELYDLNGCPAGGKLGQRNQLLIRQQLRAGSPSSSGEGSGRSSGRAGEKDWLHVNSCSYCPVRDQVLLSLNTQSEVIIVDHSCSTGEAAAHSGGKAGRGGDILWRWGNPRMYRHSTCPNGHQQLFSQHSAKFIPPGIPGEGCILVFNNGRIPDRPWSSVHRLQLPETEPFSGCYVKEDGKAFGPTHFTWTYGPAAGKSGSFYCTHISSCQPLPNGNTLIVQGPQGIIIEVTASGEEVWRYIELSEEN